MQHSHGTHVTDITSSTSALGRIQVTRPAVTWPALLVGVAVAGGVGGISIGALSHAPANYDGHLALLLQFMAALKAFTALGAAGLLTWRFRASIATGPALGYLAALAFMAVAPGLIWSLAHVAMGAICFHAGLFGFLILALRDDAVCSHLLSRRR